MGNEEEIYQSGRTEKRPRNGDFRGYRLRDIGLLKLSHLRAAAVFAAPILMALGVEASTDENHHRLMTYLIWYGLSAALILFIVGATIAIERRKRHDAPLPQRDSRTGLLVADDSSDLSVTRSRAYGVPIADVRRSHKIRIDESEARPAIEGEESPTSPLRARLGSWWRARVRRNRSRGSG